MEVKRTDSGGYVATDVKVNKNVSPLSFTCIYGKEGGLEDVKAFDSRGRSRPVPDRLRRVVLPSMYGMVVYAFRSQEAAKGHA